MILVAYSFILLCFSDSSSTLFLYNIPFLTHLSLVTFHFSRLVWCNQNQRLIYSLRQQTSTTSGVILVLQPYALQPSGL